MKPVRTLALRREPLTELTPDQLAAVAAGDAPTISVCATTLVGCTYVCTV